MSGSEPIILGIAALAAVFFAASYLFAQVGMEKGYSSSSALWFSLLANVILLWLISVFLHGFTFDVWQWRYFILAGILAPAGGRLFLFLGMKRLGLNITIPIANSHPMVAILFALAFLHEHLPWLGLVAAALVVLGGILVGLSGKRTKSGNASFDKKYLLLPIAAALLYATSIIFRKIGIVIFPEAITAAAVTVTTSWIVHSLWLCASRGINQLRVTYPGLMFFLLAGIMSGIAISLFYWSLRLGSVVLVMPMIATAPLFSLALSFVFLRRGELFNYRVIGGTVAMVIGVAMLTTFGTPHPSHRTPHKQPIHTQGNKFPSFADSVAGVWTSHGIIDTSGHTDISKFVLNVYVLQLSVLE
ncbi:MAG: DMT family transporter [Minisyncoccia bacterium]